MCVYPVRYTYLSYTTFNLRSMFATFCYGGEAMLTPACWCSSDTQLLGLEISISWGIGIRK